MSGSIALLRREELLTDPNSNRLVSKDVWNRKLVEAKLLGMTPCIRCGECAADRVIPFCDACFACFGKNSPKITDYPMEEWVRRQDIMHNL